MSAHADGEDTAIDNPEVRGTINLQARIDDTSLLLGQHRTGTSGVELGAGAVTNIVLPVGIGLDVGSRGDLGTEEFLEGRQQREGTHSLECLAHDHRIYEE